MHGDAGLAEKVRSGLGRRHPGAAAAAVKAGKATVASLGAGGFRSRFGLDGKAGAAVVILSATAAPVDRQGFTLLGELTAGS